jgi:polyisoprenoid-binding protein YceI
MLRPSTATDVPTGSGVHTLGPDQAKLTVRTRKGGAAAMAGHNLLIEVTRWNATLSLEADPALTLSADSKSMRVLEGSGGVNRLDAGDLSNIEQTIDDEVLKGGSIEFRSTAVAVGDSGRVNVDGELELLGKRRPVSFELSIGDDGQLAGETVIKQTDFGMKPYSALFGTLKVADEIRITIDGRVALVPDDTGGAS